MCPSKLSKRSWFTEAGFSFESRVLQMCRLCRLFIGRDFHPPNTCFVHPLRSWLHAVWSWWCQRLLNVHWLASVVKYSRKGRSTKNTSKVNNAHMRERKSGVRWLLYASNCASAGGSQDNTMDINIDANEYLHSVLVLINNTV